MIIGHSLGALTILALPPHLPRSHPTAILLVDPPLQYPRDGLDIIDGIFTDSCVNVKPAEVYGAENPLWTREDGIYRELGTRLCSVEAIHGILKVGGSCNCAVGKLVLIRNYLISAANRPWHFFDYLNSVPEESKVTVLVADPALTILSLVEDFHPYPRIRPVMVPGAGNWIQYEFPEVIVSEALKTVAELEMT